MNTQKQENGEKQLRTQTMKPKQKRFCEAYIIDWNGSKAYKSAYGGHLSDRVCRNNASRLLSKASVQEYIKELTADLEKAAGISKLAIILEHKKLAFNSIANLHNTWITRKDFESLSDEEKACIQEISTQTRTVYQDEEPIQVEFVKIKMYDKQKSLEQLARLMGYNRDELERLPDDQLDELYNKISKRQ